MGNHFIAAAIALLVAATPAKAEPDKTNDQPGAVTFIFENDYFFNEDRHYTTGVALTYTTEPLDRCNWTVRLAGLLPFFYLPNTCENGGAGVPDRDENELRASYELGQDIFTPSDTTLATPVATDRPYAGYLFLELGVMSKTPRRLDQAQLQIGIIGPASLAEDSQSFVHTFLGDPQSLGWSHQFRDEAGIELTYGRTLRILLTPDPRDRDRGAQTGFDFDILPHFGGAIGNVYDYINGGILLRGGLNLERDFGPLRMESGMPGTSYFSTDEAFSAYAFAGFDLRAMGRNIFLDGTAFHSSPNVSRNVAVGDFMFGWVVAYDRFRLAFTHVIRTREFSTQSGTDQFGSIALTLQCN